MTPRAPSAAAKGALWLRERFEELVEAVVAGRRLGHFARPHVRGGLLQVTVAGVTSNSGAKAKACAVANRLWRAASKLPYAFQMLGSTFPTSSTCVAEAHLQPARELDLFGLVQELREREMRLEAVPIAGLDVLDVAFAVDAEVNAEPAGFVSANPWHAPTVAPQDIHWDVEDVGVTRERTPGLGKSVKEVAPVSVRSDARRRGPGRWTVAR